eukprot:SAG11_NODE_349_length_10401_cov_22.873423_4_plen_130_part_00
MGQGRTNVDIDNVLGATLSQSPTMVAASSRRALNQERILGNKRERILALEDRAEPNSKRANNRETIEINDRRTQEKRALEPDIESQISVRSAPTEDVEGTLCRSATSLEEPGPVHPSPQCPAASLPSPR